ncbi:TPA: hypothetical protein N0F65_012590 [Lagenidium giganteum]|uniref:Uncharacterized protein n=1 Tax=Lagenidium giganteum TaxID=4803 RepID=A0AAV2YR11_9STRA|nr:TPA: hypothetical protein N0F65_012590 [Lagenidium giganteum]
MATAAAPLEPLASPDKWRVHGSRGCELLRHVGPIDPRVAEGLKRESTMPATAAELEVLMEEEKRLSITDPFQCFLYDVRAMHKKGNFKGNQGDEILNRIRALLAGERTLDLSTFVIFDDFTELLAPYLRSRVCQLTSLNLSGTQIGVQGATTIARAVNPVLQGLQFSAAHAMPLAIIRRDANTTRRLLLNKRQFNHLDAAVLGVLVERERKIIFLDLSDNLLTGPSVNVFQGLSNMFHGLRRCQYLREINLRAAGLRSEGLVDLANNLRYYLSLEKLDLSENMAGCNSFGDKSRSGIESFSSALWEALKLREVRLCNNMLDYLCAVPLSQALTVNGVMQTVDLSENPLFDAGAVQLATAVRKNAALKTIMFVEYHPSSCSSSGSNFLMHLFSLCGCHLGCEGIQALTEQLKTHNRTLYCIDLRNNPHIRSAGLKSLVASLTLNTTVGEVRLDPLATKYQKYVKKIQDLLHVNSLLTRMRQSFSSFDFAPLSEEMRTNYIEKLSALSEDELLQLFSMHVLEDARISEEDTGISNLRHYAQLESYAPLKRLLWVLDRGARHELIESRKPKRREKSSSQPDDNPLQLPPASPQRTSSSSLVVTKSSSSTVDDEADEADDDDIWDYPNDVGHEHAKEPQWHRQYGLSSFDIHVKQCKKLWIAQEELKPPHERREVPKTPPGLDQALADGGGNTKATRESIEAINRAAQESFEVHGMEKCENCGRTFAEGRLAIHNKSCRPDSVAKRVDDGAAPRNKKKQLADEYGRVKRTANPESGDDQPPSVKKSPLTTSTSDLSAAAMKQELRGASPAVIAAIQGKLDRWEATTLATLQEIRDLKALFAQLHS